MAAQNTESSRGPFGTTDLGGGLSTNAKPPIPPSGPLKPEHSQASRALGLASYFVSGCMAINASQVLGTPLYLINPEWYNTWIAFTKQSWGLLTMTMTQWWAPTVVRVSGDSTMRGQLLKTTDGGLLCDFPERMVLIANHQIYTDWLYLWWIGYAAGMHGRIYVVLKESLKRIPVIGWGMQFAQFIFLKRKWQDDKPGLAAHMQKLNKPNDPMWLMMFPEGTNLASSTRETSRKWAQKNGIKDGKHTLLPRSTGLQFMLQSLRDSVEYLYDCTIAYEGVPHGEFAQDIFTVGASYFGGRPPKSVNMYWRRFRIKSIPLDDSKQFELWLRSRWIEKDKFIDVYLRTGKFPADTGSNKNSKGEMIHGAGHIEADIKPKYWYEFLQVFAPIGVFALVLYLFYGALPQEMVDKMKSVDQKTVMKQIEAIQKGQIKVPEAQDLVAVAPKDWQNKYDAVQKFAATQNTSPEKVIAEAKKALPAGALPAGDAGPAPRPTATVSTRATAAPKLPVKPLKPTKPLPKTVLPSALPSKSSIKKQPANPTKQPKKPLAKSSGNTTSLAPKSDEKPKAKPVSQSTPQHKEGGKPGTKIPTNKHQAATPKKATIAPKPAPATQKPVPKLAEKSSSEQPVDKSVDNDAVRHALKKEMRQGKQEPKRKIRRAIEASAAKS
ncbi:MAG: hypothetical protein Q9164_002651 [Protoblastenia rupestris]